MRTFLTSITLLLIIAVSSSFRISNKEFNKLAGKWQLIEIQQIVFNSNGSHSVQKTLISNGNIKEYRLSGLEFFTTDGNNKEILSGRWHLGEGKIAETIKQDNRLRLAGKLNVLDYKVNKNKLTIEYPANLNNTAFVKEIWKKIK